jgi:hypothetical protein
MIRSLLLLAAATLACAQPQPVFPSKEADFVAKDFTFHTGEKMAELRLHYTTLGEPRRDAAGHVRNAVLVMHGTGGMGRAFLGAAFGGELFGKGQPLDINDYFVILPDAIGHGGSSKPSNRLHMKFPHYDYEDMVRADYRLVTEGLGVDHLDLGLSLPRVYGRLDAARQRAGRDRRPQSHVPRHDHAGHQKRSRVERRRVHRASRRRTDRCTICALDDDQQPAATA